MTARIQSFVKGEKLTVRRLQEIADAVNLLLAMHGSDGLIVVSGNSLRLDVEALLARIPKSQPIGLKRVKVQANAGASTTISVKELDDDGNETGDAFNVTNLNGHNWEDCYPLLQKATTNPTGHSRLLAVQFGDVWFGVPDFASPGKAT